MEAAEEALDWNYQLQSSVLLGVVEGQEQTLLSCQSSVHSILLNVLRNRNNFTISPENFTKLETIIHAIEMLKAPIE